MIDAAKNHHLGFALCACAVERFMRRNTPPNEIAMLIAEQNTVTRDAVRAAHRLLKGRNLDPLEQQLFGIFAEGAEDTIPIRQIVDSVSFAQKDEAPLLQLADACALMVRYAIEQKESALKFLEVLSDGKPQEIAVEPPLAEHGGGFKVLTFS